MKHTLARITALLMLSVAALPAADVSKPVKVFLLAGQSNMDGKASNGLLNYQATNEPRSVQKAISYQSVQRGAHGAGGGGGGGGIGAAERGLIFPANAGWFSLASGGTPH